MQIQLDIRFEQLLQMVRTLPLSQQKLLKAELDKGRLTKKKSNLEGLLLSGPVATKDQLQAIKKNRKAINQWRTT